MPSSPESDVVLDAGRSLRATRTFTSEPISDVDLRRIVDAARWTGSARNRQPWRLVAVRDESQRHLLSNLGAYATHVVQAPVVLLLAIDETSGEDAEFDAGRFAQGLMLAAAALGIASCPVTFFPRVNVDEATRLSGLEEPWRVRWAIALGHAGTPVAGRSVLPRGRLAVDEILR